MSSTANTKDNKIVNEKDNVHKGHRERLRKKYIENGLEVLEDHEVLELLLFYCIPMRDTNKLAHEMIREFGSFYNLVDASPQEIMRRCNVSGNTAVMISLIPPLAKRYDNGKWAKRAVIDSSLKAGQYAISLYKGETSECFYLICLDNQRKLIASEMLNRGTIDEAHIYPRQIVEIALKHHAAAVIISHNHTSGNLVASDKDLTSTTQIAKILQSIEIDVVDHIIVGGNNYYSFSEKKLLRHLF